MAAAIVILVFFQWKGCQDSKQTVAKAIAAELKTEQFSAAYDSIGALKDATIAGWQMDTVKWLSEKTQLLSRLANANVAVDSAKSVLTGQVGRYDAAKATGDTIGQLQACDSIRNELTKAKGAVTDLQTSAGTLTEAFGNEVGQRDSTINVLAGDFVKLRSLKDSIADAAISQAKENVKLVKQAGKHWSVGVGGGVVVGPGGISPGLSISAHYTIFRF